MDMQKNDIKIPCEWCIEIDEDEMEMYSNDDQKKVIIAYVTIYNYTINNTDLAALIIGIICLVLGLIAAIGLIKL